MKPVTDLCHFDEAFIYLANPEAVWVSEEQIFPTDTIGQLASDTCQFDDNPFSKTFSNREHLEAKFCENLQSILFETLDAEKRYRADRAEAGPEAYKKAVTKSLAEVKSILNHMIKYRDFLELNPERAGTFLEKLRVKCPVTTLRLLDYVGHLDDICFCGSFKYKEWTPAKISSLRNYLRSMSLALLRSKRSGGSAGDKISPIISHMIWTLAVLFMQYSGRKPTRAITVERVDTPVDVKTIFVEDSPFKSLCLSAYQMINEKMPDYGPSNTAFQNESFLDGAIRKSIRQLKDIQ